MSWTGGAVGLAANTSTLNVTGGLTIANGVIFSDGTINANTTTWSSGAIFATGQNVAGKNTTFNNNTTFNINCDQSYSGNGSSAAAPDVFNNIGTLTKSTTAGTTTFQTQFNNSGTVNVQTGTVAINGGGTQTGTFSLSTGTALALNGTHSFSPAGSVTGSGTLVVNGGTSVFASGATLAPGAGVTIGAGALQINSVQTIPSLRITGGHLDITKTHLFVDYGAGADPIASIAALLTTGYAGGAWSGGGINTSGALVTGGASYGLGYADSADPGNPAGLPSGTIEVAYTLLGDTNLDRTVNGVDFGILAANFNKGITGWDKGDFNYDNTVNGVDFGELAANFNKGASGASVGPSALSDPALVAFAQANGLMADVPEPVTGLMTAMAGFGLLCRRQRRRRAFPDRRN
jgi:hypothetical protein